MTFALIIAFGLNFFSYWFSDKIVLKMYRAHEVNEAQAPELFSIVRRLAQKGNLPMPRVYIIDQPQPNAFATGRNPAHGAVAVTTGIMNILSWEELEGVLAHELSHIKHRDILVGTIAATIAGAISYLAQMAQWALIFGGRDDDDGNPIVAIVMMIVAPIAALLVQLAISRSREYGADQGGAELAGNPLYLANALKKLQNAAQRVPMKANPATAHMWGYGQALQHSSADGGTDRPSRGDGLQEIREKGAFVSLSFGEQRPFFALSSWNYFFMMVK